MFRTWARTFLPNPFDRMLKKTARKGGRRILLAWNRGLGDIALGLYAMVQRIREFIPDAEVTFLTRENLRDGFSMLEGVQTISALDWKRGEIGKIDPALRAQYDLVIEKPSPTDWVYWQRGKIVPRLKWDFTHELLYEKFDLPKENLYIGVQLTAETPYGFWRNWPMEKWQEFFSRLPERVKVLLFGYGNEPKIECPNTIDLRGKTTLFELLSIVKNRCYALVLPDSGISSMVYYLDASFPIRFISLWADPNHGILKQAVASPNPQLVHRPLIGLKRDLSTVSVDAVLESLFPVKNVGAILLAGGQGTRLGLEGPKGLFSVAGKTLFQWACEKVPKHLPLAIMTSPLNHEETVAYFKQNAFFGLDVHFFQQEMAPFLDEEKKPLPLSGPNGNGSVFRSFKQAGLVDLFAQKGVDLVTVTYIENPLAKPFDPSFIWQARAEKADATVQCIPRESTDQSMGALVKDGEKVAVLEYMELESGKTYDYSYSGQIAFTLPFFSEMGDRELPLHWVRKKVQNRWIWKGEKFIFDAFPFASRVRMFKVPRETHYAPLKSRECVEKVRKKLGAKS